MRLLPIIETTDNCGGQQEHQRPKKKEDNTARASCGRTVPSRMLGTRGWTGQTHSPDHNAEEPVQRGPTPLHLAIPIRSPDPKETTNSGNAVA